jgi:hypothetical protein
LGGDYPVPGLKEQLAARETEVLSCSLSAPRTRGSPRCRNLALRRIRAVFMYVVVLPERVERIVRWPEQHRAPAIRRPLAAYRHSSTLVERRSA